MPFKPRYYLHTYIYLYICHVSYTRQKPLSIHFKDVVPWYITNLSFHHQPGCRGQFLHPDASAGLSGLRAAPSPARHAVVVGFAVARDADAAAATAADAQGMAGLRRDAGAVWGGKRREQGGRMMTLSMVKIVVFSMFHLVSWWVFHPTDDMVGFD